MRDGIDEAVVLFIPANFTDKENCVQDKTGDDRDKKRYSEQHQGDLPPVEQDPSDVQRHGQHNQQGPERDEKCYRFAATGNTHAVIISDTRGQALILQRDYLLPILAITCGRSRVPM